MLFEATKHFLIYIRTFSDIYAEMFFFYYFLFFVWLLLFNVQYALLFSKMIRLHLMYQYNFSRETAVTYSAIASNFVKNAHSGHQICLTSLKATLFWLLQITDLRNIDQKPSLSLAVFSLKKLPKLTSDCVSSTEHSGDGHISYL